jgi:16S rRNA (cytosine967-C5)-methyltransferase
MTLRVNARRGTGAAYVQRLAARPSRRHAAGRPGAGRPGRGAGRALPGAAAARLCRRRRVGAGRRGPARRPLLLGEGRAALPAGARVLDACAAPGGKTAHLLELADLDLLALDSDPVRLARVQDTLNRLHLKATVAARPADARDPRAWWDGRPFDAILLDAPCTRRGIVRRHPDVRWLRRPDDVAALARIQAELLHALWPLLAPAGGCCTPPARSSRPRAAPDRRVFATPGPRARPAAWTPVARPPAGLPDNPPLGRCPGRSRAAGRLLLRTDPQT